MSGNGKENGGKKKKKVWIPGKDGSFRSVMREIPDVKKEDEEQQQAAETPVKEWHHRRDDGPFRKERREPRTKSLDVPKPVKVEQEIKVEMLYSAGMPRSNPQQLLQLLAGAGVEMLIDVRPDTAMFAPGLVKERDLAILLKESSGIEYRREELLIPPKEIVMQFEKDKNVNRFQTSYLRHLEKNRVAERLDGRQFNKFKTVFLGEERDAGKDARGILISYLENHWRITAVHHL